MIRKKHLLEKIKRLEEKLDITEKRDEVIFSYMIDAAEHEVKYCGGETRILYTKLLNTLKDSMAFRSLPSRQKLFTVIESMWRHF